MEESANTISRRGRDIQMSEEGPLTPAWDEIERQRLSGYNQISKKRQVIAEQLERFYAEHQGKVILVNHWEPAAPITDEKIDSVHVAMRGLVSVEETAPHTEEEFYTFLDRQRQATIEALRVKRDELGELKDKP